MKFYSKILLSAVMCFFLTGEPAATASEPPAVGGKLPDITLTAPQSPELQLYLGISGKQTFAIPEIKADVVLIEIFSMY
jgi:hypothetical protein